MKTHDKRLPKHVYRRGHIFYADVRVNGQRIRRAEGETAEEAEALAARLLAENGGTEPLPAPENTDPSFDDLVDRYLDRARVFSKPGSVQSAETSCRRLREHFGGLAVSLPETRRSPPIRSPTTPQGQSRGCESRPPLPERPS